MRNALGFSISLAWIALTFSGMGCSATATSPELFPSETEADTAKQESDEPKESEARDVSSALEGALATSTISGRVTLNGRGLGEVVVNLTPRGSTVSISTSTQAGTGAYEFRDVASGVYTLIARRDGYRMEPTSSQVTVSGLSVTRDFIAILPVWQRVSAAIYNNLNGVWGSGANDVWAVGDNCELQHWDGMAWSSPWLCPGSHGDTFRRVWGSGYNDVWIVGHGVDSMAGITRFANGTWGAVPNVSAMSPSGVWGSGINDVWFAIPGAGPGVTMHYTRSGRAPPRWGIANAGPNIYGVWGSGANDVWFVGHAMSEGGSPTYGAVLHSDANGLMENLSNNRGATPYVTTAVLYSVWGSSSTDVWMVGSGGTILHWNGSLLENRSPSSVTTAGLKDIWGSGANDVWAVGAGGTILHWDGVRWQDRSNPSLATANLNGIWGSSGTDVWVVGDNRTVLRWH